MDTNFKMENKYITMIKGDTLSIGIKCVDENNNPISDIRAVTMTCRDIETGKKIIFQKSIGDGVEKSTEDSDVYIIRVAPSDTETAETGKYVYDVEIRAGSDVFTVMKGNLQIDDDVTKAGVGGREYTYNIDAVVSVTVPDIADGSITYKKLVTGTMGYVTPEMFGAVGDGVADDTEAFQKAVDNSSKLLVCGLYNVSTILINKKIKMFGTGTLSSNTTPIHINNHEKGGSFDGLTFIGKDTSVYVEYARNLKFINCEFLEASNYGIKIDAGNEVVLSCCLIKGLSEGSTGHGIYVTTSDCEFSNIVIQDFKTAVYNRGYNVFNTIHGWIMATSLFEGSTFMDTNVVQSLFCYADSFQYGYKLTGSSAVNLIGTEFYWNTTEAYPNDLKPYLIFIQDGFSDNDRIFIAGLEVNVSKGMVNPSFCNTKLKLKFDFYGLNKMYTANIDDLPEKTFTITPREYPVVINNNYVSGRCVNINYAVDLRNVDDSITGDITIGNIPEPYHPIGDILSRAFITDNVYSPSGYNEKNCYVYFSRSGNIKVKLGTVRQFCIISMSFVF